MPPCGSLYVLTRSKLYMIADPLVADVPGKEGRAGSFGTEASMGSLRGRGGPTGDGNMIVGLHWRGYERGEKILNGI